MLVKVKHKETGKVSLITPRAYDLAKKRYQHLGTVNDNEANTTGYGSPQTESQIQDQSEIQESPNKQTTAQLPVGEKAAAAVVDDQKRPKGKPGRKPSKKQISSQPEAAEV